MTAVSPATIESAVTDRGYRVKVTPTDCDKNPRKLGSLKAYEVFGLTRILKIAKPGGKHSVNRGEFCVGGTGSTDDFPLVNPYQAPNSGDVDVFVSKITYSGSGLSYSTFVGGTDTDYGAAIVVSSGNAYVTGRTASGDFPLENPYQGTFGGGGYYGDAFITKLDTSGSTLEYSTYLGGSISEMAGDISVDDFSSAYITGFTASTDFPVENPYQGTFGGSSDIPVTR